MISVHPGNIHGQALRTRQCSKSRVAANSKTPFPQAFVPIWGGTERTGAIMKQLFAE